MSNALNRDIAKGETVIVDEQYLLPRPDVESRAFVCEDGFGMRAHTMGHAIIGHWLDGTGNDRIEGYMIDVAATNDYQRSHVHS